MPSITDTVPSKAESKPTTSYKHLIAKYLEYINSKLSLFSLLFYFNLTLSLLWVVTRFPEVDLLVTGIYLCIAGLVDLLSASIQPDDGGNDPAYMDEHELREEMASIRHKLDIVIERLGDLEKRNRRVLQDLDLQKNILASKENDTKANRKEYKITPTEKKDFQEAFEKAYVSMKETPSEAADALVFGMVEWSGGCYGDDSMQIELMEDAFCIA